MSVLRVAVVSALLFGAGGCRNEPAARRRPPRRPDTARAEPVRRPAIQQPDRPPLTGRQLCSLVTAAEAGTLLGAGFQGAPEESERACAWRKGTWFVRVTTVLRDQQPESMRSLRGAALASAYVDLLASHQIQLEPVEGLGQGAFLHRGDKGSVVIVRDEYIVVVEMEGAAPPDLDRRGLLRGFAQAMRPRLDAMVPISVGGSSAGS